MNTTIRAAANTIISGIIESLPLIFYRLAMRRGVIGINYHVVCDKHLPHIKHIQPYKSTKMFEADLVYLKKHYSVVSYQDCVEHDDFRKARSVGNSIILTFDDGYSECFSVVRPLLKRHNIPCIFFVITDTIDNRVLMYRNKISLCIEQLM